MTIEEKIEIINNRVEALEIHVLVLEQDILNNPGADHPEKPTRASVLKNIKQVIQALGELKITLTNQG